MPTSFAVCIPTYNAGPEFQPLLDLLAELEDVDLCFIDSGSSDGTFEHLQKYNFQVQQISSSAFHHGSTRNALAQMTQQDILIFMTQDALPQSKEDLYRIVEPIQQGEVSACYGRQIPRPDARAIEALQRLSSYPEQSHVRSKQQTGGAVHPYFFSNSFSAVERSTFEKLGGFSDTVLVNEDMDFAYRLLNDDKKIAYVAEAQCIHSHDYRLGERLGRYFDIGVFMTDHPHCQAGSEQSRGKSLAREALFGPWPENVRDSRVRIFSELAMSWFGYQIGRHYKKLPLSWCEKISRHKAYWTQKTKNSTENRS